MLKVMLPFVGGILAVMLIGSGYGSGVPPIFWTDVRRGCVTFGAGTDLVPGGASLGTISGTAFVAGEACTVVPPIGTPAAISTRCEVNNGSAEIKVSTPIAAVSPAGQWCVEVRSVAPGYAP